MAFSAGAAVMVIELAAIRILSPWFGNSLYTWTGLIGVILCAMSGGYYFGGWLADKKTSYTVLAHILAVGALGILAIPFLSHLLGPPLQRLDLVLGPVLATLLLFALPGFFLGCVSPYIVRLISLLSADRQIGLSAGTVYMVSTLGSVLGTFAAGFWLIPHLVLEQVFYLAGGLMAGLAVLSYGAGLGWGRRLLLPLLFLALAGSGLVAAAGFSRPSPPKSLIFQKTSFYHLIRVFKKKLPSGVILTELYLDTTREGARYEGSVELPIEALRFWVLAPLLRGELRSALVLGGGSFSLPQAILARYPGAHVEVVEIDPEVVAVGRRFFGLDRFPQLKVAVDDARRHLSQTSRTYDLIFGDAYNGWRSVPSHLLTREFFATVKARLSPTGIFLMHLINAVEGQHAVLFASTLRTLAEVFPHLAVFATRPEQLHRIQSLILAAAERELSPQALQALDPRADPAVTRLLKSYLPPQTYCLKEGHLLTDSFNPVEYLVARTLR